MFAKIKKLLNNKDITPSVAAIELKKKGDICVREENNQQAASYYQQAVKISPQFVDALIGAGYAFNEIGSSEDAVRYLQQALSISEDNVDAYFMLGNIAYHKREFQSSIDFYNKALKFNPKFDIAYDMLLEVHHVLHDLESVKKVLDKAILECPELGKFLSIRAGLYFTEKDYKNVISLLEKVLQLLPNDIAALKNIVKSYIHLEQYEIAIPYLHKLIKLEAEDVWVYENLGNIYIKLGKKQEALVAFQKVVHMEPDNPVKHLVASLSGHTTETAPVAYVEQLFDGYAENFESHLTKTLNYNTPSRLLSLIQSYMELDYKKLDVIDLGCGTGLFGKVIAPYANQIVGVDLSSKMLEKAAELQIYQRLEHKELLEMMRKEPDGSYDLIAATDVFVYIGALDELVIEVKRLLRKNGFFAFSTESLETLNLASSDDKGFILNNTGRYAHAKFYLDKLAQNAGFNVIEVKDDMIRMNEGKPVLGYLSLWRS